jgi:S-formylglutathione hydrolase
MLDQTRLERFDVFDPDHGALPAVAIAPCSEERLPLCSFLYGGGGSVETRLAIEPLLTAAWREASLAPLCVACLGVPPFCFYLDDPARGMFWQRAVTHGLLDTVRRRFAERVSPARAGLVGVSMGGYGALKMAFAEPERFASVAAVAPMLEPVDSAGAVPLRNRFHYPPQVPPALLGAARDPDLFRADHPITRARRAADAIRASGLAIWIDAGSRDALNAQDGAEALHRALWDLDLAHEYHLYRDADHVGASLAPRLLEAFRWVASAGAPRAPSAEELALREHLAPLRAAALAVDPSVARTYGHL